MILLVALLALTRLAHGLAPVPAIHGNASSTCSTWTHDSCEYACYDSSSGPRLCPIVHGVAFKLCGEECYTSFQYSCNHTSANLTQLPVYKGPVSLTAVNPTAPFHGMPLNAGGEHMYLAATPGSYCPSGVVPDCPAGNTTVLIGASLAVEVPGGQQMYLQTDGAWTYTQAHSIGVYNLSVYGAGVPYARAGYFGPNGTTWIACPPPPSSTAAAASGLPWQVFGNVSGATYGDDCVGFFAKVRDLPLGTIGAWQY